MTEPFNELDERLFAVADTLRAVMKDEGGTTYTLDLTEMYAIMDGVASMRQAVLNLNAGTTIAPGDAGDEDGGGR